MAPRKSPPSTKTAQATQPVAQPARVPTEDAQVVFKGLPVADGVIIGRVLVVDDDGVRVAKRPIQAGAVEAERARLDQAVAASIAELAETQARAEKEMGKETAKIFQVHQLMLRDPGLIRPMREKIEKELVSAEFAAHAVLSGLAERFRSMGNNSFGTKVNDIDDLDMRLHKHLAGEQRGRLRSAPPGTVVVARDLTPSQAAGFDRSRIVGFVTDLGGSTSHTAIIAKALEIPAVVGVQTLLKTATDGQQIIVDGEIGTVILNPTQQTLEEYRRTIEQRRVYRVGVSELASLPAVTVDGARIAVIGNIELPDEVGKVADMGGEGVGLYRTEYLWLTSGVEPDEETHYKAYRKCVQLSQGRELVIRTFDLGADKVTQSREEVPERNPFLGNRSIRYCLRNTGMFKTQLRAILRASALGPVKIMFPLISSVGELRQAKFIVHDVMEELEEDGVKFDRSVKIGMMVEVPSAALLADTFAREVDFFSIGTNDLVQYTLAVDRINERVAYLYQHTHPAVIKLIRDVARAGRRREIPVSCCGEAAGEPEYAMLLLGLGLRTLSVTSSAIPALKRFIRSLSIQECERVARQALSLDSDGAITTLLRDRARKIVPEAFSGRSAE
ncbi:MAG: phosphoenolpyruvate--protein phosphotransferase [Phycisphaerales bacterium]